MLKNEMWKIFKATGNINAFLYLAENKNLDDKYSKKYNYIKTEENEKVLQGF